MLVITVSSALMIGLGCQQKPTLAVSENGVLLQDRDYRKVIQQGSVLFDTRSPFDFHISKVPGSINLPPNDFQVSPDPLDAARRLSLYGVTPETHVVIIGSGDQEGHLHRTQLAWEFSQLGLKRVETLKIEVFRTLNVRDEPPRKNVPLWKPEELYGELETREFYQMLEKSRPKPTTGARATVLQNPAAARVLRDRVLVVRTPDISFPQSKYAYATERIFEEGLEIFDEQGLLKANRDWGEFLKRFDKVYLIDKSPEASARAYALVQWGAKSLWLVNH